MILEFVIFLLLASNIAIAFCLRAQNDAILREIKKLQEPNLNGDDK